MSNILVLSFAISPVKGSEYAVGWNYIRHMSKYHKLFVLYAELSENLQMDEYLSGKKKIDNVKFYFCGKKKNLEKKCGVFRDFFESYRESKKLHNNAFVIAKDIIEKENIDCVHYLNPIGFKEPSDLWKLNSIPYVWGPVQATSTWPWGALSYLSFRGLKEFWLRKIFHNIQFFFNPRVRKAFKRADVIVAATPFSKKLIDKNFKKKCLYTPENAIEIKETEGVVQFNENVLQMFFAGSLIDRKGILLFLHSLVRIKKMGLLNRVHLHVFGDGYLAEKLKLFSKNNGLEKSITWHGMVDRDTLQKRIRGMHLHILPSLGEATSTILWEATAKRIPTLTLNHCGMAGVLNPKCAFLVNIDTGKKMISDIADNIVLVLNNQNLIAEKSLKLIDVINENLWEGPQGKENFWNNVYQMAIHDFYK